MSATGLDDTETARRGGKSAGAFRTISEVSAELDVPQHVLRFWESKFSQLRPLKRGGGRRYYRPEDIALLRRIRDLLYSEGYTIRGVQKLFRERNVSAARIAQAGDPPRTGAAATGAASPAGFDERRRAELRALLDDLVSLRTRLRSAIGS